MAFDAHKNLAVSSVAAAPSPPTSGTSLTVATGEGTRFPAVPFNATIAPLGAMPTPANSEIVRVSVAAGDVMTIIRAQEGTTARSIVIGDVIAATITAKTLTDIETTPYARTDTANTFTAAQKFTMQGATFTSRPWLATTDGTANSRAWRYGVNASGNLPIVPTDDAGTSSPFAAIILNRDGSITVGTDIYEKARTTPIGHWISIPYSAGNFTVPTGSWTVNSGDVQVLHYSMVGKTMLLSFAIFGSVITGTPIELQIAIPGGFTGAVGIYSTFQYRNAGDGLWYAGTSTLTSTKIRLLRDAFGTAWAAGATWVQGTVFLAVA